MAFYLAYLLAFYLTFHLAYLLAFYLAYLMRSGREHLAWILAVEVRQGTLGVDGRGSGLAGNTGPGRILAVEVRQGILGVDGRG